MEIKMNRTEILKGIHNHHRDAGLFFSPDYKRLSPSYGIDNPCMEYRGLSADVDKMIDVLSCKESITKDNVVEAFKLATYRLGELRTLGATGQAIEVDSFGHGKTDVAHQMADKLRVGADEIMVAPMKEGESVVAQQFEIIEYGAAGDTKQALQFVDGSTGGTGETADDT